MKVNLRMLETDDAPLMLEWMHDEFVVRDMKSNFAAKTLQDCLTFIKTAQDTAENLHLAIVDDNDTYMGTVSLKNILKSSAEFGITVRKCAMGKGFAKYAMQSIIEIGFSQYGLQRIYWCVAPENQRAIRFYDRNKYERCMSPAEAHNYYTAGEIDHFIWYVVNEAGIG